MAAREQEREGNSLLRQGAMNQRLQAGEDAKGALRQATEENYEKGKDKVEKRKRINERERMKVAISRYMEGQAEHSDSFGKDARVQGKKH